MEPTMCQNWLGPVLTHGPCLVN